MKLNKITVISRNDFTGLCSLRRELDDLAKRSSCEIRQSKIIQKVKPSKSLLVFPSFRRARSEDDDAGHEKKPERN